MCSLRLDLLHQDVGGVVFGVAPLASIEKPGLHRLATMYSGKRVSATIARSVRQCSHDVLRCMHRLKEM